MHQESENFQASPLGKRIKKVDAFAKVTGKAKYVEDFKQNYADLLIVKVLRSPHANANILTIDTSLAEALPGVKAVATGKDCPWMYLRTDSHALLAEKKVCWAGQGVAAVAAESEEIAKQALELIKVDYEVLPFVLNPEKAMLSDPPAVVDPLLGQYPNRLYTPEGPNIANHFKVRHGDIDQGFEEADLIIENKYYSPRISQAQLELASCIVEPHPDGGITIITNGCGAHGVVKAAICPMFKLPESKVRVIQPYIGGSFGNRLVAYMEPLAVLFALKTKKPVHFIFTRKEMFESGPSNWPVVVNIKTGVKKDGTIKAQEIRAIEDCGAHINNARDGRATSSGAMPVYHIPNLSLDTYTVNTNTPPVGSYRGLGSPQMEWAIEQQLDIIAHQLDISPLEIRLKNILRKGDRNALGELLTSSGAAECIRAVAEKIAIDEPPQELGGPWKVGKGIGLGGKQNTPLGRSEAEVRVHSDGFIELLISCDENGMGSETVFTQIVAHEFGVPTESVKVTRADTAVTPYDNYSASSRTTYTTGNAIVIACRDAIEQLKEAAGRAVGVHPSKVDIHGGKAYFKSAGVTEMPIEKLFQPFSMFSQQNFGLFKYSPVSGKGVYCPGPAIPWDKEDGQTPKMWNWYQYSAYGCELAVNTETGEIKILKAVCAADMGFPLNPTTIEGQMEGGICMASSYAINEEYLYNQNGAIINGSFMDYRLPTVLSTPERKNVSCVFCPDPLPDGPYGAKGVAESITVPVSPAIAAAIYNATGIRPLTLPMNAEKILSLLHERNS